MGPAPEMVSKLRSRRSPPAWRKACSLAAAVELVDAALRRLDRQPVEEARQSGAVARLRRLVAGDLDLVLDRLGQDRGVAASRRYARRPSPAPRRSPPPNARDRPRRSCRRGSPSVGSKSLRSWTRTPLPRCWRTSSPIFSRGDEQIGGAVVADQGEGQGDRRMVDVLAADVERPGDRIERGEHGRIGLLLLQPVGHFLALGRRGLAGIFVGMDDQPRPRRLGLVGPDRVDRVAADRDQLGALVGQRLARLGHPILGVQPGIVADPAAVRRMDLQPVGDAGLRHRLVAPVIAVDLVADLQACSGRRRRSPLPRAAPPPTPAEPWKPVSQASRWA